MKIAVLASFAPSLLNFRGPLLKEMANAGHQVIALAPENDSAIAEKLKALGVRFHSIPLHRRGFNIFSDLRYVAATSRIFAREQIDLCFAYTIKPVIFGSWAARIAKVRSINSLITGLGYTFSDTTPASRCLTALATLLYKLALRTNASVFFQNPDDLLLFQRQRIIHRGQACLLNGSGVDLNFFQSTPVPPVPAFLLLARLIRAKGVCEYAQAAQILKLRYPNSSFRLAGAYESGPDHVSRNQIQRWTQSGALEYVGELRDVRPELQRCSVFVLPSYYREGIPRTLLEAMATGRALVTTRTPGCKETVLLDQNGFLVPPRNPQALVQAMERFILKPDLAEVFGRVSRQLAERRFDVHTVNRVILERMGLK